jgi:hypothetical protein
VVDSLEVGDHELFFDMRHEVCGLSHQHLVEAVEADGKVAVLVDLHQFADDVVERFQEFFIYYLLDEIIGKTYFEVVVDIPVELLVADVIAKGDHLL